MNHLAWLVFLIFYQANSIQKKMRESPRRGILGVQKRFFFFKSKFQFFFLINIKLIKARVPDNWPRESSQYDASYRSFCRI